MQERNLATGEMSTQEPTIVNEYVPSHNEALREYEINIRFLSRGCVVRVGCKEIAFERVEDAISALQTYVKWPYEQQKAWRKILD